MSEENAQLSDEALQTVARLAERQVSLEQLIAELNKKIDEAGELYRKVSQVDLPEAMMALGLESFSLKTGYAIHVDKFYNGKIPDDRATEAFAWLRKNELESIIKRELKATFGKGEDEKATAVYQAMLAAGANPVDKQGVHPQTLKAFIRERMENAQELPLDLFGVFVGNRAKVTPPAKK